MPQQYLPSVCIDHHSGPIFFTYADIRAATSYLVDFLYCAFCQLHTSAGRHGRLRSPTGRSRGLHADTHTHLRAPPPRVCTCTARERPREHTHLAVALSYHCPPARGARRLGFPHVQLDTSIQGRTLVISSATLSTTADDSKRRYKAELGSSFILFSPKFFAAAAARRRRISHIYPK